MQFITICSYVCMCVLAYQSGGDDGVGFQWLKRLSVNQNQYGVIASVAGFSCHGGAFLSWQHSRARCGSKSTCCHKQLNTVVHFCAPKWISALMVIQTTKVTECKRGGRLNQKADDWHFLHLREKKRNRLVYRGRRGDDIRHILTYSHDSEI